MTFKVKFLVLVLSVGTLGCVAQHKAESHRYQRQVNRLAIQLQNEKKVNRSLKDENLVLRQLAGVPEPALKRVRRDGKKDLKVYSEKFLYSQVLKAFKSEDSERLARAVKVFVSQYPESTKADNAIYYKALLSLRTGKIAESLEDFDKVLDSYPKANKRSSATLGKGLAYKALKLDDQAKMLFELVVKKFPKTPEYVRAKRELKQLETKNL